MDPPQIANSRMDAASFLPKITIYGESIFIRFVWTDMTTPHFDKSFSDGSPLVSPRGREPKLWGSIVGMFDKRQHFEKGAAYSFPR
jgi:hypothetical protein